MKHISTEIKRSLSLHGFFPSKLWNPQLSHNGSHIQRWSRYLFVRIRRGEKTLNCLQFLSFLHLCSILQPRTQPHSALFFISVVSVTYVVDVCWHSRRKLLFCLFLSILPFLRWRLCLTIFHETRQRRCLCAFSWFSLRAAWSHLSYAPFLLFFWFLYCGLLKSYVLCLLRWRYSTFFCFVAFGSPPFFSP